MSNTTKNTNGSALRALVILTIAIFAAGLTSCRQNPPYYGGPPQPQGFIPDGPGIVRQAGTEISQGVSRMACSNGGSRGGAPASHFRLPQATSSNAYLVGGQYRTHTVTVHMDGTTSDDVTEWKKVDAAGLNARMESTGTTPFPGMVPRDGLPKGKASRHVPN